MNPETPTVIPWKLTEHEASLISRLLSEKVEQAEKVWRPYWQRLADSLRQAVEEAHLSCRQHKQAGLSAETKLPG
jgi:hypothetical protein